MNTSVSTAETTPFLNPKPYGTPTEVLIGTIYIVVILLGIPSNMVSVFYFFNQIVNQNTTKEFFKWIYANIAAVDLSMCLFSFPVVLIFYNNQRDSVLFHDSIFCKIWGFLWEFLPYYSVFLVLVLSISRMLILVRPMTVLSKKYLFLTLALYNILLGVAKIAFYSAGITQMDFTKRDGLCILSFVKENTNLYPIYTFFNIILLALPIIPICISCVTSISKMYKTDKAIKSAGKESNNKKNYLTTQRGRLKKSKSRNRRATITVIIMTLTYIMCNIPVFMNYVLYGVWSAMTWTKYPPSIETFYSNQLLYYYSWNLCLVLFVVINSALNPVIYFFRMAEFRQFVVNKCWGNIITVWISDNVLELSGGKVT